jgi:NAD(P)-dependent dehydrogenase (short-subunit alcohol dehydrogenase family)
MQQLRFDDKVAMVTGAGRGLGRAHALELARRGAAVVVNDIGFTEVEGGAPSGVANDVVAEIIAAGGRAAANTDDAATAGGCRRMVEQAMDSFGSIDIVIANAGTSQHVSFADMSADDFDFLMHTHLYSAFHAVKAAWPHMINKQYGRVVLTTSGVGMFGSKGSLHYGTAKGALYGMMRSLALEGEEHGIASNCYWPSAFTRMARGSEDLVSRMRAGMPVELSIPLAIWLSHESCKFNGEILHGGSGRVSRVFVAETLGYYNPAITVEDVASNLDPIMDMTEHFIWKAAIDSSEAQTRIVAASKTG